jgi:hypothetical protein
MRADRFKTWAIAAGAALLIWALAIRHGDGQWLSSSLAQQPPSAAARVEAARDRLVAIRERAGRVGDINEIKNLQRAYGYYLDKMLWDHVADLFTEDATIEIGLSGVYVGKERIREYLYSLSDGRQGPIEGEMYNHFQLQPIITLDEDGQSARGRWRGLIMAGTFGEGSGGSWGEGPYENEYIREDGVWKISKLHWYATFMAPYEGGWLNASREAVEDYSLGRGVEPDQPPSEAYEPYPGVHVPAFHYEHPVSGRRGNR